MTLALGAVLGVASAPTAGAAPSTATAPASAATASGEGTPAGSLARDQVTPSKRKNPQLGARPNDPPIGVTVETLASSPSSTVLVNGAAFPNVGDRNNFSVVVLDQATRATLESGTASRINGLGQLVAIAGNWRNPDTIMIVSGGKGIEAGQRASMNALTKAMGVTAFTEAEFTRLERGAPFSMIGYPDSREGTGWSKVAPPLDSGPGGNITGWLQFDPRDGRYNYVTGQFPTFATSVPGAPAGGNVMDVNGKRYSVQLPDGRKNGFQILKLESGSLLMAGNTAVETETYEGQRRLADLLALNSQPTTSASSPPLVLVQSIGRPVPVATGWQEASRTIESLGGTPLAFLNLGGNHDYSLVGSTLGRQFTSEASSLLGKAGPITGVLSPGRTLNYLPLVSGPVGSVNLQLVNVQYQAPRAFPAVNTAAMTTIGQQVRLCGATATSCDFRERFGSDYQASWQQIATDLNSDSVKRYPGDGRGFTAAEYEATRQELAVELSMFLQVKNYFTVLQDTLDKSGRDTRVDVKDLGDAVYNAVKPPAQSKTNAFILGAISKVLLVGSFAGPPISAVTS